ncbi:LigA [Nocardioidaceae bacterium Broad-1]|nr:LigA [Nocardioidaceae bacterium Broad-1]
MFVLDADALAAYEPRVVFDQRRTRERVIRVYVNGDRLTLPAPSALAEMLTAPGVTAYRDGARLVLDGASRTAEDLTAAILAAYRELLDRDDVSAPYDALRRVAGAELTPHVRREVDAHAARVLRCWRDSLPALPKAPQALAARRPKRPPMTSTERTREQRNALRVDGFATADAYLDQLFRAPGTAGAVVPMAKLYAACLGWVDERQGEAFDNELGRDAMCDRLDELTDALDSGDLAEVDLTRDEARRLAEDDDEVFFTVTPPGRKDFDRIAEHYGRVHKTKSGKAIEFHGEDVAARWRVELPPLART